jgi:RHS repeat-associated protein
VSKDAFNYVLHYNAADYKTINASGTDALVPGQLGSDYKPLYNGNISGMGVNIGKLNSPLWYNYKYDQLNRLVQMDAWKTPSNIWAGLQKSQDYHEGITYDPNGNIIAYQRNGLQSNAIDPIMDNLTYHYESGKNRLSYIDDVINTAAYTEDIDDQDIGNYSYDAIGNMTKDIQGNIDDIQWTVYGKIKNIIKHDNTTISYTYDASGNRISKTIGIQTTYYVRDAQGNVVSTYNMGDAGLNNGHLSQTELHLYGSGRLGIFKTDLDVTSVPGSASMELPQLGDGNSSIFKRGNKFFELSNHLGNVLVTVSDRKIPYSSNGTMIDYYNADLLSAQDYYPFGMLQPGRSYNVGGYRYGFNGKENDNEIKGEGNQQDYGMRIYDPRIGRFLSMDPLAGKYPWYTPYQFAGNSPIGFIDRDGEEPWKRKQLQFLAKMNSGIVATTVSVSTSAGAASARGHGMAVDQNGNVFYYHSTTGLAAHMGSFQSNISIAASLGYSFYNEGVDLPTISGYGQSESVSAGPGAVSGGYGIELNKKGDALGHTFTVGVGKGKLPMDASASKTVSTGLILTGSEYDRLYNLDHSTSDIV